VPIFRPLRAGLISNPNGETMSIAQALPTQPRSVGMTPFRDLMPALPGLGDLPRGRAPSPVWRDSTTDRPRFRPITKKDAAKLYQEAQRFERATRQPGKQEGALGRSALAVLHVLLFDFLSDPRGHCDPPKETLATRACMSVRTVARALVKLKAVRVLDWTRQCVAEAGQLGGVVWKQLANAYRLSPVSQWLGHRPRTPPPPPVAGTWGEPPHVPTVLEAAAAATSARECAAALELDPHDHLAAALARLSRSIQARNSEVLPERSVWPSKT
jgi:hypothetical protein